MVGVLFNAGGCGGEQVVSVEFDACRVQGEMAGECRSDEAAARTTSARASAPHAAAASPAHAHSHPTPHPLRHSPSLPLRLEQREDVVDLDGALDVAHDRTRGVVHELDANLGDTTAGAGAAEDLVGTGTGWNCQRMLGERVRRLGGEAGARARSRATGARGLAWQAEQSVAGVAGVAGVSAGHRAFQSGRKGSSCPNG